MQLSVAYKNNDVLFKILNSEHLFEKYLDNKEYYKLQQLLVPLNSKQKQTTISNLFIFIQNMLNKGNKLTEEGDLYLTIRFILNQ